MEMPSKIEKFRRPPSSYNYPITLYKALFYLGCNEFQYNYYIELMSQTQACNVNQYEHYIALMSLKISQNNPTCKDLFPQGVNIHVMAYFRRGQAINVFNYVRNILLDLSCNNLFVSTPKTKLKLDLVTTNEYI